MFSNNPFLVQKRSFTFLLLFLLLVGASHAKVWERSFSSSHFTVLYDVSGPLTSSEAYASKISNAAEKGYQRLVNEDGFPVPNRKIEIFIDRIGNSETTMDGSNVESIAIHFRTGITDDDQFPIEAAHELFHVSQFYSWGLPSTGNLWIVEATGNWAAYMATRNPNSWLAYGNGWYSQEGVSDVQSFESRSYDNVLFFVFLTENYGGISMMKRITQLFPLYGNANSLISSALVEEGYGKTFSEVFSEFAVALYTLGFSDSNISLIRQQSGWYPPGVACDLTWDGTEFSASKFCNSVNGKRAGDPLGVKSNFGAEYIRITPRSSKPLYVHFTGDGSDFKVVAVGDSYGSYSKIQFNETSPALFTTPSSLREVMLVVTKGYLGNGQFNLTVSDKELPAARVQYITARPTNTTVLLDVTQSEEYKELEQNYLKSLSDLLSVEQSIRGLNRTAEDLSNLLMASASKEEELSDTIAGLESNLASQRRALLIVQVVAGLLAIAFVISVFRVRRR